MKVVEEAEEHLREAIVEVIDEGMLDCWMLDTSKPQARGVNVKAMQMRQSEGLTGGGEGGLNEGMGLTGLGEGDGDGVGDGDGEGLMDGEGGDGRHTGGTKLLEPLHWEPVPLTVKV